MKTLFKWLTLALVISFLTVWLILPTYFSWRMSDMMETKTRIRQIFLNPKAMIFKDLKINNIPGYMQIPVAMTADRIDIEGPLTTYLMKEIVIDKIHADGIHLGIVFDNNKSPKGNWSHIMSAMTPTEAEKKAHTRSVLIKELVVTNISAEVYYRNDQHRYQIPNIKTITLTNLKSHGGLPTEQIMNTALGNTLHKLFIQENIGNMVEGIVIPTALELLLLPIE